MCRSEQHEQLLLTNLTALKATYERLSSRDDLTQVEQNKLCEIFTVYKSIEAEYNSYIK